MRTFLTDLKVASFSWKHMPKQLTQPSKHVLDEAERAQEGAAFEHWEPLSTDPPLAKLVAQTV